MTFEQSTIAEMQIA